MSFAPEEVAMSSIGYMTYGRGRMVKGRTPDGAILEWHKGCSGTKHAWHLEKLFLDDAGKVTSVEPLAVVVRGDCDGTCTPKNRGFFSVEVLEVAQSPQS